MSDTKQILKKLFVFTIPLVLSGILQQLFSWVDAFIVGNVVGENALSAIGITSVVHTLFITLLIGFTSGLSIQFAQLYGANKISEMKKSMEEYILVLLIVFTLFTFLGIFSMDFILKMMDTPVSLFKGAKEYGIILFMGIPFLTLYNLYSSLLRAMGNSKVSFYAVLLSSIFNVGLDLLLVAVFPYGVKGAAIATLISQIGMSIYLIYYTHKTYENLRVSLSLKCDVNTLKEGSKYGFPPAIQSGVISVGNVILQKFMNGFGEYTVAAISTAYRIDSLLLLPITNFGTGIATLVAQNVGANNINESKKIMKIGMVTMCFISIGLTLLILLFGESLVAMFGLSKQSIEIGKTFFYTIAMFYIICGLNSVIRGYLEGIGDLIFTGTMGILSLGVRIISSYTFVNIFGNMVIAYAEAFSWIFLLIVYVLRYIYKGHMSRICKNEMIK